MRFAHPEFLHFLWIVPLLIFVASLWITTETESTATILQQCGPGTSAATQGSSRTVAAELFPPNACDRTSAVGCQA